MKNLRNDSYTIYKGVQVELTQNSHDQYFLIYRGDTPPDETFRKVVITPPAYNKDVSENEIENAFGVITFASYRGFVFQVLQFDLGKYELVTSNLKAAIKLNLHERERGCYEINVLPNEIEKMWEERRPMDLGFPFPEGLKKIEEIPF